MNNFSLRTYVPSDAQSVVEVINASSALTVGFPRAVVDAVGNLWAFCFIAFSSEKVVAINEQNEVVGYAYFSSSDEHIVAETGGAVHPEYCGKGIDTALVKLAEDCAEVASRHAPTGIKSFLQTTLFESEPDAIKLFTDRGYSNVREWVHLVLEMHGPPMVPALASNLTLREMDLDNDWDIVGPAMDEAYVDHWGVISPGTFDVVEQEKSEINEANEDDPPEDSSYSNAPGYCFIVLDGDIVAGGILCNAKLAERIDTGRVGSLFVRPGYRRQGIARTLMLTSFDAFWKNGFRRVITDTDAKSFTDAPKLYKGLGMKPYRNEFTFEKEIRTGREVRRLD